nr:5-oxoprolinase subunit PxpA [uncultured Pseudoxanthomonas sp.]
MRTIDFNCDLGEACGDDAAILPYISSASIACGFHAGSPETMRRTVALCIAHGVAIGAHPSHADRENFGRVAHPITPEDAYALTLYQIGALDGFVRAAGARLHHVKPHGALYNQAAREPGLADAIARAVRDHDAALVLYGLSGSALTAAGERLGLQVAHEAFAERRYEADATLTPRTHGDASIEDLPTAAAQVARMLEAGRVVARTGESVTLRADSICLHGDRPDAAAFARGLRDTIEAAGFAIRTMERRA